MFIYVEMRTFVHISCKKEGLLSDGILSQKQQDEGENDDEKEKKRREKETNGEQRARDIRQNN